MITFAGAQTFDNWFIGQDGALRPSRTLHCCSGTFAPCGGATFSDVSVSMPMEISDLEHTEARDQAMSTFSGVVDQKGFGGGQV